MTRKTGFVLSAVLVSALVAGSGWAISVKTLNIQKMVQLSDRVFYGRCLSAVDSAEETLGYSVRVYRFLVLEGLKNTQEGQIVEFRQLAPRGRGINIPGMPQFSKGQSLLLFLHGTSRLGLTSPVGLQQGIFEPEELETGETAFTNGYGNRNLDQDLTPQMRTQAGLGGAEVQALEDGQPLSLSVFRDIVLKLDRYNDQIEGRVQ